MSTSAPSSSNEPIPIRTELFTKRKVHDTVSTLDAAVRETERGTQTKKRRITPAKSTISTPALVSLLSLSKRLPTPTKTIAPPPLSYTPTSLPALLARIGTFTLSTYSPLKPSSLDPVSAALLGWTNTGREKLTCTTCSSNLIISGPSKGGNWNSTVGAKLAEEWSRQLRESHGLQCPWRARGCSRSLYKVTGGSRKDLLGELVKGVEEMEWMGLGRIRVAKVLDEKEEGEVKTVIEKYIKEVAGKGKRQDTGGNEQETEVDDSSTAPLPPTSINLNLVILILTDWALHPSSSIATPILTCSLCTRKVLASSYIPISPPPTQTTSDPASPSKSPKTFDPISQHAPFCPFIITSASYSSSVSAPIPSLASSTISLSSTLSSTPKENSSIPGWRVRLNSLLMKNHLGGAEGSQLEREGRLKSGTKELMSYVRGLLGPKTKVLGSGRK